MKLITRGFVNSKANSNKYKTRDCRYILLLVTSPDGNESSNDQQTYHHVSQNPEDTSGDVEIQHDSSSLDSDVSHYNGLLQDNDCRESPDPSNSDHIVSSDSEHDSQTFRAKWAEFVLKHKLSRQCIRDILQLL